MNRGLTDTAELVKSHVTSVSLRKHFLKIYKNFGKKAHEKDLKSLDFWWEKKMTVCVNSLFSFEFLVIAANYSNYFYELLVYPQ